MIDFRQPARQMLDHGFSVIPCNSDKTPAIPSWKKFQDRVMSPDEVDKYFARAERIAVIGGAVSGNLIIYDFDDPTTYEPFLDLLELREIGLSKLLPKRQTPKGNHIFCRSTGPVKGNQKLACDPTGKVRIETRGEGGYALAAPSPGYMVLEHSLLNCPVLSEKQIEILDSTARVFDQREQSSVGTQAHQKTNAGGENRPGDRFKEDHSITELLQKYGWKPSGRTTGGHGWTRPGKEHGTSGVHLEDSGNFYCWSSNATPLEPGRSYDAFALYAAYEHTGDYSAAARSLTNNQGKGTDRECKSGTVAKVATVAVADWPEPLPLVPHQQIDPYPLDALPGSVGAAVREVVAFVQCPVALGACSALAVVSLVGQGIVDVRRASQLSGPTSLYFMAIADSGERKTSVDGYFKKPVEDWEAEQAEAAKPGLKRYETESQAWEAKKSGIISAIKEFTKKGEDTGDLEKKLADLEIEKPEPPKVPRLLFSDATPEALAYRLAHDWPVGGVLSSEAGIVFGGHAMGKESAMRNMSTLNSLWGAESFTIDRRTSSSYTVRNARLTMGLAVQSETVRAFLDASKGLARGIGWLARFLIAWPESTQGTRMYQDPPEHWPHLAKFRRRLGTLLDQPLPLDENGELAPVMLELSPEAKEVWVAFHDEVEEELRPGRDMAEARDVASKAADICARLAALFHLFENDPGGTIGPDHMQAAATVITWHLYEARRFMGEIAVPIELNNAAKLNDWLLEYCKLNRAVEVTTRTIQQMGPVCARDKPKLDKALEELAEAGRVQVVKDARRKLVKINPILLGAGHGLA